MPRCATGWGHSSVTELCPLHEVTARDSQAGRAVGGGSPIAPCPCPPSSAPCPLALPAPQARSRYEATVTAPFPGLCRNVTAQSHLELKVWICHTLRNELLGAASVSLGSLLKGGGKRTYGGPGLRLACPGQRGQDRGGRSGSCAARQGTRCRCVPWAGRAGSRTCVSPGAAAGSETQTPLLFAAVCGCQSVACDSSSHIKAAIQGWGGASGRTGLEKAGSVSSKQSL